MEAGRRRRVPNAAEDAAEEEAEEEEEEEEEEKAAMETAPAITPNKTSSHPRDDSQEAAGKYRRYEKEYLRRINHKYFSSSTFSGEPVYESSISIGAFLFKESKESPLKKFVDGPGLIEDNGKGGDAAPSRKNINRKN